ncbi:MAG: hypothetical protein IJQ25_07670, partial [Oscillibacter sp.]|nr:hypothetical protein [Oscillibacter sp.]
KANTKEGETGTAAYIGGLAGHCRDDSTFTHCYAAGFLVSNIRDTTKAPLQGADDVAKVLKDTAQPIAAAGFVPNAVARIENAYSIFNFDDPTLGITGIVAGQHKGQPAVLNITRYGLAPEVTTTDNAFYAYGGNVASNGKNQGTATDRDSLKRKEIASDFKPSTGADKPETTLYDLWHSELEQPENPYPYPVLTGAEYQHHNDYLVTNSKKLVSVTIDRSREAALSTELLKVTHGNAYDTLSDSDKTKVEEIVANYLSHSQNTEPKSGNVEEVEVATGDVRQSVKEVLTPYRRANGERFVGWYTKDNFASYKSYLAKLQTLPNPVQYWDSSQSQAADWTNSETLFNTDESFTGVQLLFKGMGYDATATHELYAVYEHLDPFLVTVENRYYSESRMRTMFERLLEVEKGNDPENPDNPILSGITRETIFTEVETADYKTKNVLNETLAKILTAETSVTFTDDDAEKGTATTLVLHRNRWKTAQEGEKTLNELMREAFGGSHLSQPEYVSVDTTDPDYDATKDGDYTFLPFSIQAIGDEDKPINLALQKAEYCARFDENGKFLGFCQINSVGEIQGQGTNPETYKITGLPQSGDLNQDAVDEYRNGDVTFTKHDVTFGQAAIKLDRKSTYVALYADIPFDLKVELEFGNTNAESEGGVFTPDASHQAEGQENVWSKPEDLKTALFAAQTALNDHATATVKITGSLGATVLNNIDKLTFEGFTLNEKLTQSSIILARGTNTTKV